MKLFLIVASIAFLGCTALPAQTVDNSGNGMLKGAYHFRHVLILNYDQSLHPSQTRAASGVIAFDGAGNYSLNGSYVDNVTSKGTATSFSTVGKYVIGASGFGYVSNPFVPAQSLWGAVAQGVFIGSDTEGSVGDFGTADLFVAIPSGSLLTNSFTGTYASGLLDFPAGVDAAVSNAMFKLAFNGQGALGNISISGQSANQSASISEVSTGATYSFNSDGSATLNVPLPLGVVAPKVLFTGSKTLFVSADTQFVLGWSPNGYDIFFGIKSLTGTASNTLFSGTYFTSGLEDSPIDSGVDSFYGSVLSPSGDGHATVEQRYESPYQSGAFDFATDSQLTVNADGTASDKRSLPYQYIFGDNGLGFVGTGSSGLFSLIIGLRASGLTAGGTFLSPVGILNAASYSPITAPLAPGQLVALFGTGLSSSKLVAGAACSTSLGGVQVLIDNKQAPICYVSPNQLNIQVPFTLASTRRLVTVQVNNAGTLSNLASVWVNDALPAVFTADGTGRGIASAIRADGSLVSATNPVQPGETVSLYLTALGSVAPPVADGVAAPMKPLSYSNLYENQSFAVFFDDYNSGNVGVQGSVSFAGLAPGFVGLYQVNVQVPAGVGPGNVYLNLQSDNASVEQVQLPVSGLKATSSAQQIGRPTSNK